MTPDHDAGTRPGRALAEQYVERYAALDPIGATFEGIPGHDHELTDYSPAGVNERLAHTRATRRELDALTPADEHERVAAEALRRFLETDEDLTSSGEDLRALRVIGSPVSEIRLCFDLMPQETEHDWETITARVGLVPQAIAGFIETLQEGVREGLFAAPRQATACAEQADAFAGLSDDGPFFPGLADALGASGLGLDALHARLTTDAARATEAYASLGRYLVEEYLPVTTAPDAVGADRYRRFARAFTGTVLDLDETYEWGWEELYRIEHAMGSVAERILPGQSLADVTAHLEHDPTRVVEGEDALKAWLQDLIDRTFDELDGTHFDIPETIRHCEAMISPPGGAAAMYYTGPSEDFSRPGRTWYPTQGRTTFPLWGEVSTCYHEAVPGHHLQVATTRYLRDRLDRFQRTIGWNSGYGEGWALYAERLMGELGYLEDPAFELGMLRAQAMRAMRVIVDIGLHLQKSIPTSERYHPGEVWTPELALPFVLERSYYPESFMKSEVDRYLGWPGQAISYKVGERVWLRARDAARARAGGAFDLKRFHTEALELGPLGLDQLEEELAKL
jgi:uncharacterized protein (DUF885 family)